MRALVAIETPMPLWWVTPHLWPWLRQHPELNFDDAGPTTALDLEDEMRRRREAGERTWGVSFAGDPVGAIGYAPITHRLGTFHGICFTDEVQGLGIAQTAVRMVLDDLYAEGVEKVSASFFAHNTRVHRFFARLGAVEEGLLRAHTTRHGQPIDMRLMALFAPKTHGI